MYGACDVLRLCNTTIEHVIFCKGRYQEMLQRVSAAKPARETFPTWLTYGPIWDRSRQFEKCEAGIHHLVLLHWVYL